MALDQPYFVLAFYTFQAILDPQAELALQKETLSKLDSSSRLYISEEGLNGQLCLLREHALRYVDWMHSRKQFKNLEFKVQEWHEHAFPRLTIKYRKRLVGRDREVDLSNQGQHLSPAEWKGMLETEKEPLLLDLRNDYEWKVGRFEGAALPPCTTFREFEGYAEELKKTHDPEKKKVMMYCTGGIRCEIYSALLKQLGFKHVYQLQGGIIKYGLSEGAARWLGKLFVFDDRLTVPISKEEAPVIGTCHVCGTPSESYFNCANIDCNKLYLCCPACLEKLQGCCSASCKDSPRIRPYQHQNPHKPFRRKHHYHLT